MLSFLLILTIFYNNNSKFVGSYNFIVFQLLFFLTLMQVTNGGVLQEHVVSYVCESDC